MEKEEGKRKKLSFLILSCAQKQCFRRSLFQTHNFSSSSANRVKKRKRPLASNPLLARERLEADYATMTETCQIRSTVPVLFSIEQVALLDASGDLNRQESRDKRRTDLAPQQTTNKQTRLNLRFGTHTDQPRFTLVEGRRVKKVSLDSSGAIWI